MARPYLSIIIPAYNEAERIPVTLLDVDRRLAKTPYSYEIIVVNDGSKDNTAEVAERMKSAVRGLKVIDNAENRGKGAAVRQGMLLAGGTVRLFMDADNSTSIDQFDGMVPLLKDGYDVVIGSRAVNGAKLDPPEPVWRALIGRFLNILVRIVLLPGIRDTQCGFKAFTAEAAAKIFELADLDGWGFDIEVLALAKAMGCRIAEMPVHWANDARSHVRASAGLEFLRDLAVVRRRLSKGKYAIPREAGGPADAPLDTHSSHAA